MSDSDTETEVVTRFAANPTRHLDVSDARLALLNRLYAKSIGGRFVLRMDNLGRAGADDKLAVAIRNDLRWLGIDWAQEVTQSERVERYREAFYDLKECGLVYPCFETADELAARRKQRRDLGQAPIYDRAALGLTPEQRKEFKAAGRRLHWRFRLSDGVVGWTDAARGAITLSSGSVSDPVVMQGNGDALYALSSVVDDVDHGITHVITGNEPITTTAAQIQIYAALNAPTPVFSHLPSPVTKRGDKVSRRMFSVRDLKERGIEPLTIASLLITLGTPRGVIARLSLEELANRLNLDELAGVANAILPGDFEDLNPKVVRALSFKTVRKRLVEMGLPDVNEPFWLAIRARLSMLSETETWWRLVHGPCQLVVEDPSAANMAASVLPRGEWDQSTWLSWKHTAGVATKLGGVALDRLLRLAITGVEDGPEMSILLPLIGRAGVQARLAGKAV